MPRTEKRHRPPHNTSHARPSSQSLSLSSMVITSILAPPLTTELIILLGLLALPALAVLGERDDVPRTAGLAGVPLVCHPISGERDLLATIESEPGTPLDLLAAGAFFAKGAVEPARAALASARGDWSTEARAA